MRGQDFITFELVAKIQNQGTHKSLDLSFTKKLDLIIFGSHPSMTTIGSNRRILPLNRERGFLFSASAPPQLWLEEFFCNVLDFVGVHVKG